MIQSAKVRHDPTIDNVIFDRGAPKMSSRTAEDDAGLILAWRAGDKRALDKLVKLHRGLVFNVVKRYVPPRLDLSMADLIQEGWIGVVEAAERFDISRGLKFSTYAMWWIRARVVDYSIRTKGPVRIGSTRDARKVVFRITGALRALEAPDGTPPSHEAIAAYIGVSTETVREVWPRIYAQDVSMDAEQWANGGGSMHNAFASDAEDVSDVLGEAQEDARLRAAVRTFVDRLDVRERRILRARYLGRRVRTLDEIGKKLGVSRERVRQIEARAIRKIREMVAQASIAPGASRALVF